MLCLGRANRAGEVPNNQLEEQVRIMLGSVIQAHIANVPKDWLLDTLLGGSFSFVQTCEGKKGRS